MIDKKIGDVELTPTLNSLKKSGLFFPDFYAIRGGGGSSDAEYSSITGLMPYPNIATMSYFDLGHVPSLARILNAEGYQTLAMHGNYSTYWNRGQAYKQLGFDSFVGGESFEGVAKGFHSLDHAFLEQSIDQFKASRQDDSPFLLYLITQSMHGTHPNLPEEFINPDIVFDDADTQTFFRVVHYVDGAIRRFLMELNNEGILQDTAVLIFGDHATRRDVAGHYSGYREGENVPLIILLPGPGSSRNRDSGKSSGYNTDIT